MTRRPPVSARSISSSRFGVDLPRPAAVIVGEPTLMQVADAHKGVATFRTVVTGLEAHSAHPELGASAISAACGNRRRDRPAGARAGEQARPRRALRSRLFDLSRRPDPRRDGAQHSGARMRHRLGVPRPAEPCRRRRRARQVQRFIDETALPRLRRHRPEPDHRDDHGRRRAGARRPSRARPPRRWRCGSRAPMRRSRSPTRRKPGISSARASPTIVCGPGSIEQAHKPDEYIAVEAQLAACLAFLDRLATDR